VPQRSGRWSGRREAGTSPLAARLPLPDSGPWERRDASASPAPRHARSVSRTSNVEVRLALPRDCIAQSLESLIPVCNTGEMVGKGHGLEQMADLGVAILLDAGVRASEMRHLRVQDVDLAERWIIVRCGKGVRAVSFRYAGALFSSLRNSC
jgi:integrase